MNYLELSIDCERLFSTINEVVKITKNNKVYISEAANDVNKISRDIIVKWFNECGCEVVIDEIGNIFAKRPGKNPNIGAILCGSHLGLHNSSMNNFATVGVLGALEIMRTINDNNIFLERDLVIVNWTNNEETTDIPFLPGSGVWTGNTTKELLFLKDEESEKVFLTEELERIGYKGTYPASYKNWNIFAAFELCVEKNIVFSENKIKIGIAEGQNSRTIYDFRIKKIDSQTKLDFSLENSDALLAFSELNLFLHNFNKESKCFLLTVGKIENYPNLRNINSIEVNFSIDIKSTDTKVAIEQFEQINDELVLIARKHGCEIEKKLSFQSRSREFDKELIDIIEEAAKELNYANTKFITNGVFDIGELSEITKSALIVIPDCLNGNNIEEYKNVKDILKKVNVLLHSIIKTANMVD